MATLTSCIQWATESLQQCTQWQTDTERSCSNWDSRCCTWWPCSWACKLVTWFCVAWSYISTTFCVAWTVVVTTTCVAWSIVEILITPLTWIVDLILTIPIIGRFIDWVRNFVREIISRLIGIPEFLGSLIGIRLLKKMKVCIVILRDESGNAMTTEANLQASIQAAQNIYLNECNVQLQIEGIRTVDKPSPTNALDVSCNAGALGDDIWTAGSYFELMANLYFPLSVSGRLGGLSPTIVVFVVRTVDGGPPDSTIGCAMWSVTDYLTLEPDPLCLAHEIGHKCGLWHVSDPVNLMNGSCGNSLLDNYQEAIIRSSPYVSYAF
jgi:hypothetical protein